MVHDPIDLTKTLHSVTMAITGLVHHHGPMDRLRALTSALHAAERLTERIRKARDQQIATLAKAEKYGYTRIGRAAGMSASRASRIARAAGAPARAIYEDKSLPPS